MAAPPEDGKANAALVQLLADALGAARRNIRIAAGETSRLKTVEIEGETGALMARLRGAGRGGMSAAIIDGKALRRG